MTETPEGCRFDCPTGPHWHTSYGIAYEGAVAAYERGDWTNGQPTFTPPLRRRVRLRLAATRRVDKTCGWLCEHRVHWLAIAIWRTCGLWPSTRRPRRG